MRCDVLDDFGFLKGRRRSADLKTLRKTARRIIAGEIH
jgi:hypothetical protein